MVYRSRFRGLANRVGSDGESTLCQCSRRKAFFRVGLCRGPPPERDAGELARPYAKPERFGLLILLGLVFVVPMAARQFGVASSRKRRLCGTLCVLAES